MAFAINCEGVADSIIKEIANPHERNTGSERAMRILKDYRNTNDEKLGYYNELLKSIEFWALCYPHSLNDEEEMSPIKFIYSEL